jgi:hypothetical protein
MAFCNDTPNWSFCIVCSDSRAMVHGLEQSGVGMPRSKKVRLTCDVTPEVKNGLAALGRSIQLKKGGLARAIRKCLEKAYAAKNAPIRDFLGEESEACSIEVTAEEIVALHAYQTHHELGEQRKGFKSALLRGFSIHLDESASQKTAPRVVSSKPGRSAPKLPL